MRLRFGCLTLFSILLWYKAGYCNSVYERYIGFTVESVLGGQDISVLFSQHGEGKNNSQSYDFLYDGATTFVYDDGISSSFEAGVRYTNVFTGIELLYLNYETKGNLGTSELKVNDIGLLLNLLYFFPFSEEYCLYVYSGGGIGMNVMNITNSSYLLNHLVSSSTPATGTNSYVSTNKYPQGFLESGYKWEAAFQLRLGLADQIEPGVYLSLGMIYYGTSNVNQVKGLGYTTSDASVTLNGVASPVNVVMSSQTLKMSDFKFSNYGVELSIRIAFND